MPSSHPHTFVKAEQYGTVDSLRHRHVKSERDRKPTRNQPSFSYHGEGLNHGGKGTDIDRAISTSYQVFQYRYNGTTAFFLLPPLLSMYCRYHSPIPFIASSYAILTLYALDLYASDIVPLAVWIAFGIISLSLIWDHYDSNGDDSWSWFTFFFQVIILFCLGCWATLQNEWLATSDVVNYGMTMERMLHTLLPLGSAFVMAHSAFGWFGDSNEICPYIFATVLCYGIVHLAQSKSSFPMKQKHDDDQIRRKRVRNIDIDERVLEESDGKLLSYSLLCLPTIIHIWGKNTQKDDGVTATEELAAVILIMSTSHSLHWILGLKGFLWWQEREFIPREFSFIMDWKFLVSILVTLLCFEYRYLIPITEIISHELHGKVTKPSWLVCLYFSVGILCMGASALFYGRRNADGRLLGGDSHDDLFQIMVLGSVVIMGMALPLPLEIILLLASSLITIGLFVYTKMLRYMIVATLVAMTGILSIFSFQLKFVRHDMLIVPGYFTIRIFGFHTILVGLGAIILLVYAIIVRGEGGRMQRSLESIDLCGLLLVGYSGILTIVEASLHHGCDTVASENRDLYQECEYPKQYILLTSLILILLSIGIYRINATREISSTFVMAISVGKAISILARNRQHDPEIEHATFLVNTVILSFFILIIRLPYVVLKPVYPSRRQHQDKSLEDASKVIAIYCAFVLPFSIFAATPAIITPMIVHIKGYGGYYKIIPRSSETLGSFMAVWGFTVLCLIRHFLSHGGVHGWRKLSFGACILGLVLMITAPSNPFASEIGRNHSFLLISSIDTQGFWQKIRAAWGLVSASLGLLLFVFGPLRFGTTRGGKARENMILRVVVFSLLFGCGLSWFLAAQIARSFTRPQMILAVSSSVVSSFLFTLSAAFCYTTSDRDFNAAQSMTAFSLSVSNFLILSGVIIDIFQNRKLTISGSWYTSLLLTSCLFLFLISYVTKLRRKRTNRTRHLANKCSIISWLEAIFTIYGYFGIASIDVKSEWKYIFDIPTSVIFTTAASLLLSTIQLDNNERKSQHTRFRGRDKSSNRRLPSLMHDSDSHSIPLLFSLVVFIIVTFYVTCIRGLTGKVHLSHKDVLLSGTEERSSVLFELVQGYLNHSRNVALSSKLAACGIWTAKSFTGPMKHLCCLIFGPTFTCCLFLLYLFSGGSLRTSLFSLAMALNASTLILCKGIPSLSAAAYIGIVVAVMCSILRKNTERRSRMSI